MKHRFTGIISVVSLADNSHHTSIWSANMLYYYAAMCLDRYINREIKIGLYIDELRHGPRDQASDCLFHPFKYDDNWHLAIHHNLTNRVIFVDCSSDRDQNVRFDLNKMTSPGDSGFFDKIGKRRLYNSPKKPNNGEVDPKDQFKVTRLFTKISRCNAINVLGIIYGICCTRNILDFLVQSHAKFNKFDITLFYTQELSTMDRHLIDKVHFGEGFYLYLAQAKAAHASKLAAVQDAPKRPAEQSAQENAPKRRKNAAPVAPVPAAATPKPRRDSAAQPVVTGPPEESSSEESMETAVSELSSVESSPVRDSAVVQEAPKSHAAQGSPSFAFGARVPSNVQQQGRRAVAAPKSVASSSASYNFKVDAKVSLPATRDLTSQAYKQKTPDKPSIDILIEHPGPQGKSFFPKNGAVAVEFPIIQELGHNISKNGAAKKTSRPLKVESSAQKAEPLPNVFSEKLATDILGMLKQDYKFIDDPDGIDSILDFIQTMFAGPYGSGKYHECRYMCKDAVVARTSKSVRDPFEYDNAYYNEDLAIDNQSQLFPLIVNEKELYLMEFVRSPTEDARHAVVNIVSIHKGYLKKQQILESKLFRDLVEKYCFLYNRKIVSINFRNFEPSDASLVSKVSLMFYLVVWWCKYERFPKSQNTKNAAVAHFRDALVALAHAIRGKTVKIGAIKSILSHIA